MATGPAKLPLPTGTPMERPAVHGAGCCPKPQSMPTRARRAAFSGQRLAMRTAGADVTLYVELPGGKP